MRLGRYGQLVGLLAREAGFDTVENEVEAECVRLLADQDVNELSRRGGDERICVWREAEHHCARPFGIVLRVFARSEGGVAERVDEQRAEHLAA